jgi:hypothetical protein
MKHPCFVATASRLMDLPVAGGNSEAPVKGLKVDVHAVQDATTDLVLCVEEGFSKKKKSSNSKLPLMGGQICNVAIFQKGLRAL